MTERGGPLAGVRVLEIGSMVAGPVAATLLGDFGADIIKLELPGIGDPIRKSGTLIDGESLYWNVEGRNKRSVTLNLRVADGQKILHELVKHADVLIENFRPGTMAGWNCGYDQVRAINPQLIYLSISGYGQTGPKADQASYDRVALAFSGFLNMTGYPDRPPVRPGTAVADYQSALFGAFSVMIALFHRDARGGVGQHLDLSLYETIFRFTDTMVAAYDKAGVTRERRGNSHYAASPGDHYETSDGRFLALTVAADNVFRRLCKAIGRPELGDDPRFVSHPQRVENYDEINGIVADWIRGNALDAVMRALSANTVPHALIYSVEDIVKDPHYAARESIVTVDNPRIGPIKMQGIFPKMSETPADALRVAPELGENTVEILTGLLGMTRAEIVRLRDIGVV
jgi:crotonobetainyl-CoA:carnitine CoA-transferase CaiB-like acyl-CoA transferase